ncbi:MAG: DNRLRE domain-containing protein [Sandaracinaceae bacterium]|nr:DNRLRE domain-containing protein [Sandaracinaceae bacterium]
MIFDVYASPIFRVDRDQVLGTPGIRGLVRATLRFSPFDGANTNSVVSVHRMRQNWEEPSATWNCPSDYDLTNYTPECNPASWNIDAADPWDRPYAVAATDTILLDDIPAWVEFDVTADVLGLLDGDPGHGWIVRVESGNPYVYFASRENGSNPSPELVLEMRDDSFVPTACPPPDLDDSRITRVADVVEHVYSGACPVQFGASDSVLVPEAVAHLRGKVIGPDGTGLSGVHVRILGRSDFGWTRSRAGAGDLGTWDLVVNGGGPLVVEFSKPGYLTVQRRVEPIRNDYLVLDDVVLLPQQDGNDCAHVSGATGDFYLGPVMTDARGSRRLGMYFPSGSTMTITDASSSTVTDYCICSVEYTADRTGGATGQRAMPGALPTTSAYTYAAELQLRPFDPMAGTCDDAPIPEPTFSAPIFAYVLDHDQSAGTTFVGFGVGTAVPSGYYDEDAAAWVAEPDGRVVQIVDNGSGGCAFDVTGDGVADSIIDGVAAHHVTAAELAAFASHCGAGLEYSIGDRLWRIPVYHFSPRTGTGPSRSSAEPCFPSSSGPATAA